MNKNEQETFVVYQGFVFASENNSVNLINVIQLSAFKILICALTKPLFLEKSQLTECK